VGRKFDAWICCVILRNDINIVYDFNESFFLDVQPHIDVMASLLFVNINGIPVMYAAF